MRRLALVLVLVLTPGPGWSAGGRLTVVKPAAGEALRGSQAAARPTPARPSPAPPTSGGRAARLLSPLPSSILADPAAECRTRCAQDRYFCEASNDSDGCASVWGQCVAACTSPNLVTPVIGDFTVN